MGCYYYVGDIRFPVDKTDEVEKLIKEHEMEGVFQITAEGWLTETDGSMSYGTSSQITDEFLPAIAKLLVGTEFEGQVIDTDFENEPGTIVLINGDAKEFDGEHHTIELPPEHTVKPGEMDVVPVMATVFGLSNQKALVISVK